MKIMTVDPGYNTGYAVWQDGKLVHNGVYRARKLDNAEFDRRQKHLWDEFEYLLSLYFPHKVYIENISVYSNSAKSMASATKGDLTKLAVIAGGYAALSFRKNIDVEFVEPRKWKGQLSDQNIKEWTFKATGKHFREHERDAVGIGCYILRLGYWGGGRND